MAKPKKTVKRSGPLVAIDLGSSGVRAMAAKRTSEGTLHVLGFEQVNERPDCIDCGVITQSSDAGYLIAKVLRQLQNRIGSKEELGSVFVARGGRSMKVVAVSSFRDLGRASEIAPRILQELERECYDKIDHSDQLARVVGLVPMAYLLDENRQTSEPTPEQHARRIEVQYCAFVMQKDYVDSFDKSFQQAFKLVESSFLRPEALLTAFSAQDGDQIQRDGVAILDLGAQTTSLSIYHGESYLVNKVVPIGSDHITRVIAMQGMSIPTAEVVKTEYGFASPAQVKQSHRMQIPSNLPDREPLMLTTVALAEIIEGKLMEIFDPIFPLLEQFQSEYKYLYVTGGGAMLGGLIPWLQDHTSAEVRGGIHDAVLTRSTPDEYGSPRFTSLVGALLLGADWRDRHPEKSGLLNFFLTAVDAVDKTVLDLFPDENS